MNPSPNKTYYLEIEIGEGWKKRSKEKKAIIYAGLT